MMTDDENDLAATFKAMREATREHRANMLEQADTTGWEELTEYHFRRWFGNTRVDWWPSGGKAQTWTKGAGKSPRMVYGHRKVADLVKRLGGNANAG